MILDTGASFTMVSPQLLSEIGCDPASSVDVRKITTASSVEHVSFVTVSTIEALGYKLNNIEIVSHTLPMTLPAEGLLGLNFLSKFNLHLKFLDDTLAITDQKET